MSPRISCDVLHPGENARLELEFTAASENKSQQAFAELKLTEATSIRILLKAEVRGQFVPAATKLHFRTKHNAVIDAKSLFIDTFHVDSAPIVRRSSDSEWLHVGNPIRINQQNPNGDGDAVKAIASWKVDVSVDGAKLTQPATERILISSENTASPIYVSVSAERYEAIRVFPPFLLAEISRSADTFETAIQVVASPGESLPSSVLASWNDAEDTPVNATVLSSARKTMRLQLMLRDLENLRQNGGNAIELKMFFDAGRTDLLSIPVRFISKRDVVDDAF